MSTKTTDWLNKEKRELFAKAVNSMLMTTPKLKIETATKRAKKIVDTAFKNYPDRVEQVAKKNQEQVIDEETGEATTAEDLDL